MIDKREDWTVLLTEVNINFKKAKENKHGLPNSRTEQVTCRLIYVVKKNPQKTTRYIYVVTYFFFTTSRILVILEQIAFFWQQIQTAHVR